MARTSLSQLTLGVSLAALATWTAPALAQGAAGTAQQAGEADGTEEPEAGEDIVVTGSRLARDPNATAPSPITQVTAADIRATGQTDVSEVLREIPALIASGTIADSIDRGAGGIGQATLNLRNLGSNRTLVLINGRRQVSGVAGTQIVDIATIPTALIDNVDVLTGGASAVYGADAVTGVVNFNLKRNFEGLTLGGQVGISDQGDARTFTVDGAYGLNFGDGRGNITIAGSYNHNQELKAGAREFTRDNAQTTFQSNFTNPARRFQLGDITAATPNFQSRFSIANGRYPYGFSIPTAAQFATQFPGVTPTAAEQALIDRAANAPSLALGAFPTFSISSGLGLFGRADYEPFTTDTDNNGVADCDDSFIGSVVFLGQFLGGCLVSEPGGRVRPFRDGVIVSTGNQFGGDGSPESINAVSLIPQNQRYDINLLGSYEFSEAFEAFVEAKYVRSETRSQPGAPNSFYDQLYIYPENPFIPTVLQADADDAGGLLVSRDFYDIPNLSSSDRDTYRAVLGARGDITPNLKYEIYGNYGRTDNATTSLSVLPDRLFAAIDVIAGPNGQPICRSNVDDTPHPGSQYFPVITPGFFTFTPGDGQCVPVNLFNGINSVTPEAVDFITEPTTTNSRLEQLVLAAELRGDTDAFFRLPGGAVQFAVGAEYREEKSRTRFDPLDLGLLPAGSPAGAEGTFVGDIDPDKQSLTFDTTLRSLNTGGRFDVKEIFAELRVPILADRPFFHELSVEGAARYSHYSTIGSTFTWNVNGIYAPVRDLRIRGTYAVAIRAPNITELFNPQQGNTFRPLDPCDQTVIDALIAGNDPAAQNRLANCRADGIPEGYLDPLTARFGGTTGGNPDLQEETATTYTIGAVLQPRFIPRLTITADYYNIKIEDAIANVSAQNIVNACYDSGTFPNQYCDLFTRNRNANSPTFLGFNFLRQTALNFGRLETAGVDVSVAYSFNLGENRFNLRGTGSWVDKVDSFFDPINPELVDPALGEAAVPEWAAVGSVTYGRGPYSLTYRLQYLSEQTLFGVDIERLDIEYGPGVIVKEQFIHDVSFNIDATDRFSFYGGVNNLTDKRPFRNILSYPVSPVGRFFFVGARAKF